MSGTVVKAFGLIDVDLLKDVAVQECCFDVYLLDLQVVRSRNCDKSFVAYRLNDGGKGRKEILTLSLLEAPDYPSGLISHNGPLLAPRLHL